MGWVEPHGIGESDGHRPASLYLEWVSEWASERTNGRSGSAVISVANEWAVRANEWTAERMAQYSWFHGHSTQCALVLQMNLHFQFSVSALSGPHSLIPSFIHLSRMETASKQASSRSIYQIRIRIYQRSLFRKKKNAIRNKKQCMKRNFCWFLEIESKVSTFHDPSVWWRSVCPCSWEIN